MNKELQVNYFNDFIELIPQPVCLLKACNKVIYAWNKEFENLTGFSYTELEGKPWSVIFDLDSKPDWKNWIQELNKKESINDIPARVVDARRKKIPVIFSLKRIRLDGEDFFLIVVNDISELVESDRQNRKTLIRDQRLRFHYENSPLALVEWDNEFIVTRWSKRAEQMFGWKAKETLGKPIQNLNMIFPEDIPIVETTMNRLGSGKERMVVSGNRNVTKNGRIIYCIWYNSVLVDEFGQMISVMSMVNDVTEQREYEETIRQYSVDLEKMVQERTSELNHLKDNLEELVQERTAELQANNRKLTKEIVARRRAVEALKESERKYREIVQNIPGMVFQLKVQRDGSNKFTYLSPHAGDLFDLPFEEITNEWEFTNHIHPDDRANFISSIGHAISNHTPWNFEGRILTLNNDIKWFEGISSPALVGQELVMDGLMLDVTEKKLAQEVIRQKEEHFRSLFSSIQEGFHQSKLIFDDNGRAVDFEFIVVNEAFGSQTGLDVDQIIGKKASEVFPKLEPVWLETYGRIVKTGTPEHFESYNTDTDKTYSVFAYHTFDDNFAVIFYDQSEKMDFYQRIESAQEKARESQELYSRLFDAMTEGVQVIEMIFDDDEKPVDWVYLSVNPAWYEQTGLQQDVVGMNVKTLIPDVEEVWLETFGEVVKTGTPKIFVNHNRSTNRLYFTYTYKLKDHQVVVVLKDISEETRIREDLEINEKRFRLLFETMEEAFQMVEVIYNKKGEAIDLKYIRVNPAWYLNTGITVNVEGKFATEVIPGLEKIFIEKNDQVARTGVPEKFEAFNAFTDHYYSILAHRMDRNTVASLFHDITRQRMEENEIKVNLTKYQVLFDSFPLGITISDKDGKILEVNSKAREILEMDSGEVILGNIADKSWTIVKPDGSILPSEEFASVVALKNNKVITNQEMGLVNEKGDTRWINVTAAPIPLKGYGVAITYNDISDKVRNREILEESERSYKTLFSVIEEGFAVHEIILDEDGNPCDYKFLDVNPAFEEITGLKKEIILGKKIREILPKIEKDFIKIYGEVALTGKAVKFENYSHELKKYFEIFCYSPGYGQFATIFKDISEIKNIGSQKKNKSEK
ncbi:MAG: PAS domain S-box protein [Syntrophothermus sp.]